MKNYTEDTVNMIDIIKGKINKYFASELQRLKKLDYILLYFFYRLKESVKENQVFILSESRTSLSGNLKYIDEKINKDKFNVIYSFKKSILINRTLSEKKVFCRILATSKYILVDDFIPTMYPIPLRKDTRFIQVWHAMGAFKKVGFSRVGKPGGPSKRSLTHRNYTDAIVSSEEIRKDYAEAFGISIDKVHALGIPRTDIFFDSDYRKKIRRKLEEKYPGIINKKVILFAPTFRGNGVKTAHYDYSWISLKKIQEKLEKDYIFIIKMHPFIKNKYKETIESSFFLDLSEEREINDLLFITDILITDYSSVIFEASLLDIRTIFFAPDLEEYITTRDFYYPYEEYTFGPVVINDDELIDAIKRENIDFDKLEKFKAKFCSSCDGKSTERFVKYFFDGECICQS